MALTIGDRSVFSDSAAFPVAIDVDVLDEATFVLVYSRSGFIYTRIGDRQTGVYGAEQIIMPGTVTRVTNLDGTNFVVLGCYSGTNYVYLFKKVGTTVTYVDETSFGGGDFEIADVHRMSDTMVVAVGNDNSGAGTTLYYRAIEIDPGVSMTVGTEATATGAGTVKTLAKTDNFNDTYGITAVRGVSYYPTGRQLVVFSLSGTTITTSVPFLGFDTERASLDVACLDDTYAIDANVEGGLSVSLYSRSGLTLTMEDTLSIESPPFPSSFEVSIKTISSSKALLFWYDDTDDKNYAQIIDIDGTSLSFDGDTVEVDDVGSYYSSILELAVFSEYDYIFAYNYRPTNYEAVIRVGAIPAPVTSTFIPKIMII